MRSPQGSRFQSDGGGPQLTQATGNATVDCHWWLFGDEPNGLRGQSKVHDGLAVKRGGFSGVGAISL